MRPCWLCQPGTIPTCATVYLQLASSKWKLVPACKGSWNSLHSRYFQEYERVRPM